MKYNIYRDEQFRTSNWTGGTTKQLAIFPEHASYLDRNFVWRLSTAVCEREESDFTRLPDYDRVLMVLSGNVVLAHRDVRVARLSPLEQDQFDGAYRTKCFGKMTDYNLIMAKGCDGCLSALTVTAESQKVELEPAGGHEQRAVTFYCRDGFATVSVQGEIVMLQMGEQLVITADTREWLDISVMGDGALICGQILYDDRPEEREATVIPREKASFDDFLCCMYLANIQFHGAQFIFRKLKRQWFDEELSKAIRKMEKFYLTFLVCMLGLLGIVWWGNEHMTGISWLWLCAAWIIADILIVSPLMYFAVMPKPVRKHIKDIDHLTPYEQKVREKELNTNERVEKLMKKYKNSGRPTHDKDGNPIER